MSDGTQGPQSLYILLLSRPTSDELLQMFSQSPTKISKS